MTGRPRKASSVTPVDFEPGPVEEAVEVAAVEPLRAAPFGWLAGDVPHAVSLGSLAEKEHHMMIGVVHGASCVL
jgi:hypothetical protein